MSTKQYLILICIHIMLMIISFTSDGFPYTTNLFHSFLCFIYSLYFVYFVWKDKKHAKIHFFFLLFLAPGCLQGICNVFHVESSIFDSMIGFISATGVAAFPLVYGTNCITHLFGNGIILLWILFWAVLLCKCGKTVFKKNQ